MFVFLTEWKNNQELWFEFKLKLLPHFWCFLSLTLGATLDSPQCHDSLPVTNSVQSDPKLSLKTSLLPSVKKKKKKKKTNSPCLGYLKPASFLSDVCHPSDHTWNVISSESSWPASLGLICLLYNPVWNFLSHFILFNNKMRIRKSTYTKTTGRLNGTTY